MELGDKALDDKALDEMGIGGSGNGMNEKPMYDRSITGRPRPLRAQDRVARILGPRKGLVVFLLMVAMVAAFAPLAQNVEASSAPGSVGSVSVSRSDGSLTASWSAPSGATKYHITYSSNGGGSWSLASLDHSGTSITIGVDNSKTYLVGVRAGNDNGWSGWTNSPSSGPYFPPDTERVKPPAAPSSVSVSRSDGSLTASWPAVSGATSYHVTYTSTHKQSWELGASNHTSTSITISADNTKTYYVAVRARNKGGDSSWTDSPSSGPYTSPQDSAHDGPLPHIRQPHDPRPVVDQRRRHRHAAPAHGHGQL